MKQKVGLLVDSLKVSKQLKDFIDLSLTSENYEVTTIILNDGQIFSDGALKKLYEYARKRGFSKLINKLFFILLTKVERKVISKKLIFKNYYSSHELSKNDYEIINVTPIMSESGLSYTYNDLDIEKIKNANLQLIVRGGRKIIKGKILTCCPDGIISFHHADNDENRGGPAGFWEVYKKHPRTGFIIQRLNEKLDAGEVLYKGFIRTSWFYSLNKANLFEISYPFLHKTIDEITSNSSFIKKFPKVPYIGRLYTLPNIAQILNYLLKTLVIFLRKKISTFFGRRIRWNVAYQFTE
ncbi:MAG: hypothetical protein VW946_02510, partial [Gammaproteobacteria bacterium]